MINRYGGDLSQGQNFTPSKDCIKEQCTGTALFDTACQDYVCSRCNAHHKGRCQVCDWRDEDVGFTVDPDEAVGK